MTSRKICNSWKILAELLNTVDEVSIIADRVGVTGQRVYQVMRQAEELGIGGLSPRMTKVTRDRSAGIACVAEMADQGLTASKIAETLNVAVSTARRWADATGRSLSEKAGRRSIRNFARTIALVQNTELTQKAIAKEVGLSGMMVSKIIRTARDSGIKTVKRKGGRPPAKPI
ncbi:MAG: hypothetical protein O7D91_17605 [Planctomycetota bacterium]|nr:hypothetical protein [Planctomycetota bacterium]